MTIHAADQPRGQELDTFEEAQRIIAARNREEEARELRELDAIDDAIAGIERDELRRLRDQLESGEDRVAIVPHG